MGLMLAEVHKNTDHTFLNIADISGGGLSTTPVFGTIFRCPAGTLFIEAYFQLTGVDGNANAVLTTQLRQVYGELAQSDATAASIANTGDTYCIVDGAAVTTGYPLIKAMGGSQVITDVLAAQFVNGPSGAIGGPIPFHQYLAFTLEESATVFTAGAVEITEVHFWR